MGCVCHRRETSLGSDFGTDRIDLPPWAAIGSTSEIGSVAGIPRYTQQLDEGRQIESGTGTFVEDFGDGIGVHRDIERVHRIGEPL
jgi:hypothetical protein